MYSCNAFHHIPPFLLFIKWEKFTPIVKDRSRLSKIAQKPIPIYYTDSIVNHNHNLISLGKNSPTRMEKKECNYNYIQMIGIIHLWAQQFHTLSHRNTIGNVKLTLVLVIVLSTFLSRALTNLLKFTSTLRNRHLAHPPTES